MVLFSSRISPFTSTVIFFDRSPLATAVVTSAMLRTWPVRFAAIAFTLSVRSFQVPATPSTCAWPPSLPSVPTSRATRVTSPENALSWSTLLLTVLFLSRFSPLSRSVIFFDRSPFATAVVTSAMLRTWPVRFAAIAFTLSVRSFQVPATPSTCAWPPSLPSVPTSRATRVTSPENALSWSTIVLMVLFSSRISPFTSTVIFFDRSPFATAVVTSAMPRTWVVRFASSWFTLLVRSRHNPAAPGTIAWPPSLPSMPTSRATRVTSPENALSWSTLLLTVLFLSRFSPLSRSVIFFDRSPFATAVVTSAMLRTWPVRFAAIAFTLSVRSFQVPATPSTCAWPPSLPSVPTSRATRVTSPENALSWSTIVLMVLFSSRISPFTSTVIFFDRSPFATAVVTSAMPRTWVVRFASSWFTLLVRSRHNPAAPGTIAWPPSLPSMPTSRATRVTSPENALSWSTLLLTVLFLSRFSPLSRSVIFFDRSPFATAVVTSAMLRTWPVRFAAIAFTLSVRSFQVPATPSTCAWPPSLPSVPTSRATRVTSPENALSWSTIVLMVLFSSRISPFTSTVIFFDRSPFATAVVTSAMPRTWVVRFASSWFTLLVRSRHNPAAPGTIAWPPSLPSMPTSRATRVTSPENALSWSTIVLMVLFSSRISPFTSTVIFFDRSPLATAVVTSAMLRTWPVRFAAIRFTLSVRSFQVPATPSTCAWPPSLPSVPTSRATRVTSPENALSWSTIVLMVLFSSRISPFTSTVIFFDRSPFATAVVTSAMPRTWVVRFASSWFTLLVRSRHNPAAPGTIAWPPSLPSMPTSRATRVTSPENALSWSTIVLMVLFSSRISPFTSTVIVFDKSPLATAVVTSAMLRTWPVRFAAIRFTLSVRSFQVPATPGTCAWPPSLPSVPTSRATRVTSEANALSWSTIVLMVLFSSRISPFTSTVIFFDRSPFATAVVTSAMPRTWVVRFASSWFTLLVRSRHNPAAPGTIAWPPSLPSMPTSRATRVTSPENALSWSTIVLMVLFSSRISPFTSTVIFFDRSPLATAVVTSAMLRTWPVRFAAIRFTLSVRSFQVPATPSTCAWPPSLPSVPTSRATRVTSPENALSWSTIVLMVLFSSRISPFTSTVIFFDRSPLATAVVTSAMLRTWPVRLVAMAFTLSVRSFQVPATSCTLAWPPSLPSVPTSRATRVTSEANELSWSTIVLTVFFSSRISPLTSTATFFERSPRATAFVTSAMSRTWLVRLLAIRFTLSVRSFQVPATSRTCAWPPSLPSVPTSRATRVTSAANELS